MDSTSSNFWDTHYGGRDKAWSGNPNPHLVDVATPLPPGRALDIGSGEGADALWLAARGWTVTGVDISPVAVRRARDAATKAGLDEQAAFVDADFEEWASTASSQFDLVSIQFLHLESAKRDRMIEVASTLVADGGTIVVVGHDLAGQQLVHEHPGMADIYFAPDRIQALLSPRATWHVQSAQIVAREPSAQSHHVADVVVTAVRYG